MHKENENAKGDKPLPLNGHPCVSASVHVFAFMG